MSKNWPSSLYDGGKLSLRSLSCSLSQLFPMHHEASPVTEWGAPRQCMHSEDRILSQRLLVDPHPPDRPAGAERRGLAWGHGHERTPLICRGWPVWRTRGGRDAEHMSELGSPWLDERSTDVRWGSCIVPRICKRTGMSALMQTREWQRGLRGQIARRGSASGPPTSAHILLSSLLPENLIFSCDGVVS